MPRSRNFHNVLKGLAICAAYIIAGKLSLRLASVHPSATPVWPPTGIAIVTLLTLGLRFWPSIFCGAFLVNLTTLGTIFTSLGIAAGNTLEAVVACVLVNRFANGARTFDRTWDILRFALYAGLLSTAVAATFGVFSLTLGGFAPWSQYGIIWRTWWLGDAAGALVFTPFLLLWIQNPRLKWSERQLLELTILFCALFFTATIVFGPLFHFQIRNDPWTFVCTPFLVWAAFRFGQREASAAVCLMGAIAVVGTVQGYGPFTRENANDSLLLLQCFVAFKAVMTLVFASEVSQRHRQEEHTRLLSVSDPLTNLSNYRHLRDRLDSEIKRYTRTGRPFSVLLLDLDGLKRINDARGHIVGSRALCRVAEVLRAHCREIDTPARYGGDEFALVLPETHLEEACLVAERITQRLVEDTESPKLTVSIGAAEYPRDGSSVEHILSAADQALYNEKHKIVRTPVPRS
jgi:diguanylate cyclase (GGDEF)-like protein